MSGARSFAINVCHTTPPELAEFHQQLNDLLKVESIRSIETLVSGHLITGRDPKPTPSLKGEAETNLPNTSCLLRKIIYTNEEKSRSEVSATKISKWRKSSDQAEINPTPITK